MAKPVLAILSSIVICNIVNIVPIVMVCVNNVYMNCNIESLIDSTTGEPEE